MTSDLLEMRKIPVRRVWSSMKVINHNFLGEIVTLDGPQTSLWIRVKGWVGLYGCEGMKTGCCLARRCTSQDKVKTSTLEKRWGNKCSIH